MHNMDVLVSLISLLLVVAGAGASSPANSKAEMEYWQTVLPETPMPPAILDLLTARADELGSDDFKFVKGLRKIGPNFERVKSEGSLLVASQVEEDVKKISVSYGSQGEEDGSRVKQDLKKIFAACRPQEPEENLKEISVSYGSQGEEDMKKVPVDLKRIFAAYKPQVEANLKEISVSYGSIGEDDVKKISMSYGLEGEDDLKKISVSYGIEGREDLKDLMVPYGSEYEDDLKKISVSYGSKGGKDEEEPNKISVSYGSELEEDVKKISMGYGSHTEGGKKLAAFFGNLLHKVIERSPPSKGAITAGEGRYHNHRNVNKRVADVFFFHDMLRPGSMITPTIPPTTSLPALLPRRVAASLPFSAERLPDIVAMFAPASLAMAGEMRWTLDTCEHPRPLPGQRAGCATSLESLAELPATLLGTRDVRAFSAGAGMPVEAAGTLALRGRHNVTAVRRLSAGSTSEEIVTCHDLTYPYAVFYCHTASRTAVYAVTLQAASGEDDGAAAMEVLAVCHLDTSLWSPRNPFFEAHGVKPGDVAVCHFLTKLSIVWVRAGAGEQGDASAAQ